MSEPVTDEQTWEDEDVREESDIREDEEARKEDELHEPEPILRRPRRRLLTPVTALLFALLLGAGGFIAGVQVEKGEVSSSSSSRGAGRLAGLLSATGRSTAAGTSTGGRGFAAAGGAGATVGQVEYVSGADLYVTNLEGNTVKVLTDGAQITKQVNSTVKGVHPGDTVIVQGATHTNGSVQATTVRDSGSSGASGGGAALFGGASGGSSGSGATRTSPNEPALFGK